MSEPRAPRPVEGSDLVVTDLSVRYGPAVAVAGVSRVFQAGHVSAVVGPNGAGKSSTLQALAGGVRSTGTVQLGAKNLTGLSPAARANSGVGLVPQGRQIFPTLTVAENLAVFAEVLSSGKESIELAIERFPRLAERRATLAGNLSGGEQQMLSVSRALMTDCDLLLFDEMTTGLAPRIVDELLEVARDLASEGAVVVVAEASCGAIRDSIDNGSVMIRGRIVADVDGGDELDAAYREAMGMGTQI